MEAQIALVVVRWLLPVAGLVVAVLAYWRASLRVDIPNTLMQECSKLKGDLKALTGSVEQTLGAFEDRMNAAQKRNAAYASHEARRTNSAQPGEGAEPVVEVEAEPVGASAFVGGDGPVTGRLAQIAASDPHAARQMVRNARVQASRGRG